MSVAFKVSNSKMAPFNVVIVITVGLLLLNLDTAFALEMEGYSCCVAKLLNITCSESKQFDYSSLSDILHCDVETGLSLQDDDCITTNNVTGTIEIGKCVYNHNIKVSYLPIPSNIVDINEYTCSKYNRMGTLCGKCKDSHYPLAYSLNTKCKKHPNCNSNWWKFAIAAFLPLTFFYLLILLLKINITSTYLQGFVLFSQVVSMPALARAINSSLSNSHNVLIGYRIIGGLCAIWNLDSLI